jgi:hypothetical protein
MGFLRWWDAIFVAVAVLLLTDAIKWRRYWKSFKWTHAEHFGDLISTDVRWLAWVLAAWPPSTSRHSHTCPC